MQEINLFLFDICPIFFLANRVFAVKGSEVYRTVGPPFEKYYDNNGNNIVNFAAGIEQFIYTTGDDR